MLQQHSSNIGNRWTPYGTREICPWNYAQYFMHSNCYRCQNISRKCSPYPHQQLGRMKSLCKVDSTQAQQWPKSHACYSCHHPSATLKKWRQCISWSHFNGWQVMDAAIWLSWNNRMLNEIPKCHRERKLHGTVRVVEAMHVMFFSEMDLYLIIPHQLVWQSMTIITAHPCRICWGQLFIINNQNCLSMVSFYAGQCNISSPLWCATTGATFGLGDIGTSSLLSRSRPMWLLVVFMCERTSSR